MDTEYAISKKSIMYFPYIFYWDTLYVLKIVKKFSIMASACSVDSLDYVDPNTLHKYVDDMKKNLAQIDH